MNVYDSVIQSRKIAPSNMFVMVLALLDGYIGWLSPTLHMLKDEIGYSDYNSCNQRVSGFIAEHLLNILVMGKGLSPTRCPLHRPDDNTWFDSFKKFY